MLFCSLMFGSAFGSCVLFALIIGLMHGWRGVTLAVCLYLTLLGVTLFGLFLLRNDPS